MLIEEITQLNAWIQLNETKHGFVSKLGQLYQILNANVSAGQRNNQNNKIQPFADEKIQAIDAIKKIDIGELSSDQIECLNVHKAINYLGPSAAERMTEMFRDDSHDLAHITNQINEMYQVLNTTKTQIDAVSKSVSPYVEVLTATEYLNQDSRFSIVFKEGVKVGSLKDLEARSKEWSIVMHGIGVALDVPPSDFRVLGARNGSFVIDLYMAAAAIVPIGIILTRSFNLLEQFALSVRKLHEVFTLELKDPKFKEIEAEIKSTSDKYFKLSKKIAAKDISKEVLDELDCDPDRREEADAHLQTSIKKILDHLRKGGDIDAFVPDAEPNAESEESEESKTTASIARKLIHEFRHKKLDHHSEIMKLLEFFEFDDTAPAGDDQA